MGSKYIPKQSTIEGRIGKIFNRLTIIGFNHIGKGNNVYYTCLCECGSEKIICWAHICTGKIKSCGCLKKEIEESKKIEDAASRSLFRHYKQNAKCRSLNFDLSYDIFLNLTNSNCFYCGESPNQVWKVPSLNTYVYNGLDRIDNNKGYSEDNVVTCCSDCNYLKSNRNQDIFLSIIKRIYEYKFTA